MTDPLTGAATIVGLTVVAKPAAELVKDFLGRVLAPTGDAFGQSLAHPIAEWQKRRVERASRLVTEAAAVVSQVGAEPQPVPGRLLIPILEKGSLEEDDDLHDRWVNLLANASLKPGAILPSFVAILGELSPLEATVLSHLYRLRLEGPMLVNPVELRNMIQFRGRLSEMETIITNLIRLALIRTPVSEEDKYRLTRFGAEFVIACSSQESPRLR
jgi:hypothetical protein